MEINLPVGYHRFTKNNFLNYQLNRWYAEGFFEKDALSEIGNQIHSFSTYVDTFLKHHEKNLNTKEGVFSLRAAEFLIDPKSSLKKETYNKFIHAFDNMFGENFTRHKIPYENSFLNCLRFEHKGNFRGTIVAIGGFDSLIEEFYGIWFELAKSGYDVIAFEGPGQGGTLREFNLTFDHDYEKPTKAVIDFFNLKECIALGLSMGGYWIMRAASFETRITKVIAMPPVYDWLELTNKFNRKLVRLLLRLPGLMNVLIRMKMISKTLKHTVAHTLFIIGKNQPVDAVKWMLGMNAKHLSSEKIKQDVLLITGENDAFQPPKLTHKQAVALTNAKSVTTKILTKKDFADQHCQMGNLNLAVETMREWLSKLN